MCGITFLFDLQQSSAELDAKADAAVKTLYHRGPDDKGKISGDHWVSAHTRLSIIDLRASRQPMQDESGRYILSFNGEIYNYKELQSELRDKWAFQTNGDTETLLAGLCIFGESFISKLQGMWALTFWDQKTHRLLLSRDRLGKKPLFYTEENTFFACASELPALAKCCKSSWEEDVSSTADFLRYGYYLPGHTAYKEVKELLPGHNLIWQPSRPPTISCYWTPSICTYQGGKPEAIQNLRSTLIDSIKKRMVSDVEVGAFLSGGIDSSLIVAIMHKELNIKPKTFTVGFNEYSYDERHHARSVANLYPNEHFEDILYGFSPDDLLNLVINHCGQPFGDVSILPSSLLAKLASQHVKVVLSGDGADELFSGYQRYHARMLFRLYSVLPSGLTGPFEKILLNMKEPSLHHSHSLIKKAKLFVNAYKRHLDNPNYVAPEFINTSLLKEIAPGLPSGHSLNVNWDITSEDDVKDMMLKDAQIYLPQDILTKVDRATMAHSLEARTPFLDSTLVETAFSFPRHWHRNFTSGKHLLKQTFPNHLPAEIWHRRKQGFSVPINNWFCTFLGENLEQLLNEQNSILNKQKVQQLITDHRKKINDYSFTLWNIFIYLAWKSHALG